MRQLRRVTEPEVVAEFLRNEFYQPEFHRDRDRFEKLVMEADLGSERDNALRRSLLFRRRGTMWRELPPDTQWWEVRLEPADLPRLRIFPRAQWRRLANGDYGVLAVVERIRRLQRCCRSTGFLAKIQSLSYRLRHEKDDSAVLLIGVEAAGPLTVIEGNHRLAAALLTSPELLQQRFRFFCGLSPAMERCCWHRSDLRNLWRYGRHRLQYLLYDPDADVDRIARTPATPAPAAGLAEAVGAGKAMPESK